MPVNKSNTLLYLLSRTWKYSEGRRYKVAIYWLMLVMSEAINTFWLPFVTSLIIDVAVNRGINKETLPKLSLLLLLIVGRSFATWLFHGPARIMESSNAFEVKAGYREYLLRGVMNLPLKWHVSHHSGEVIDKVNKGADSLYDFTSESFQIVKPMIGLVGSLSMIVYFNPASLAVVVIMMAICGIITVRIDRILGPMYLDLKRMENKIAKRIQDAIANIATLVILRVEHLVLRSVMMAVMEPFEKARRAQRLNELKWFLTSVSVSVMMSGVLAVYFYQHMGTTRVSAGEIFLLLNYLDRIGDLFYLFTSLNDWMIRKKFGILNAEELSEDFKDCDAYDHVLPTDWKMLEIKNLTFSHNDDGDAHLDNVNVTISRGQKIAVVGFSGGGKTTFLTVMRGEHLPSTLSLQVDGVKVAQGFTGIKDAISLVPQKPDVLDMTVRENITLGVDYDENLINYYCEMSCFTDVCERLPNGLESSVFERGVNLSGGESQRLALARGLLASHDRDIVLLDEPTSSLDAYNESIIYSKIFTGFAGRTIISTVHKMHLLAMFDRVLVFDNGELVGDGVVSELLVNCPQFMKLWRDSTH